MRSLILLIFVLSIHAHAESLAPKLNKLSHEEIGQWVGKVRISSKIDKLIIRRGLISDQTALRADCARYLATHGDQSDIPFLIDSLSDDSMHAGASYIYSGMATTRYWANVALVSITKIDLGFRWDDSEEKRNEAILRWTNHWNSIKHKQG